MHPPGHAAPIHSLPTTAGGVNDAGSYVTRGDKCPGARARTCRGTWYKPRAVASHAPARDGHPGPEGLGGRLAAVWSKLEPAIFAIWCGAVAGFTAGMFVESMLVQTGRAFSAPLDDVFIHFDYARAAAERAAAAGD